MTACGSALTTCRSPADMSGSEAGDQRRGNETLKSQQAPVAKREPAEKPGAD